MNPIDKLRESIESKLDDFLDELFDLGDSDKTDDRFMEAEDECISS